MIHSLFMVLLSVGPAGAKGEPVVVDPRDLRVLVSRSEWTFYAVPLSVDLPRGPVLLTSICGDPLAGGTTSAALAAWRVDPDEAIGALFAQMDAAIAPCLEPALLRLYRVCPGIRPDPRTVAAEAAAVEDLMERHTAADVARATLTTSLGGGCGTGVEDTIGAALIRGLGSPPAAAP